MDERVWSNLPDDLIELLFARLPWTCVPCLRILNKHWNSEILSEFFRSRQQAVPSQNFPLVGMNRVRIGCLNVLLANASATGLGSWRDHLPLHYARSRNISHKAINVASCEGELAISTRGDHAVSPVLCNKILVGKPELRSLWRNLRSPLLVLDLTSFWRSDFRSYTKATMKMEIEATTKNYMIILALDSIRTENSPSNIIIRNHDGFTRFLLQTEQPIHESYQLTARAYKLIHAAVAFLIFDISQNAQSLILYPPRSTENNYICISRIA